VAFAVVFALAAAFSNAVNLMTRHSASVTAPKRKKGWRGTRRLTLPVSFADSQVMGRLELPFPPWPVSSAGAWLSFANSPEATYC
jgi:hypothetical protein